MAGACAYRHKPHNQEIKMVRFSTLALAAALATIGVASAQAQFNGPSITYNSDVRSTDARVQTGRSISPRDRVLDTRRGDQAEDAASAFAFGSF
jgi:hypothetical protein